MAQIAALLHRAADMTHEPTTKEVKYLLPKPALSLREPRPQQWANMVQQAWNNIMHNPPAGCKAQVLGKIYSIFYSSYFLFFNYLYLFFFVLFDSIYLGKFILNLKSRYLNSKILFHIYIISFFLN